MPPYSRFSSFHSVGSRVLARPWDQAGRRRTGSVCSQKRRYIMEEFVLATISMTGENKGFSPHQLTACHNARALVVTLICPYGLFIPHRFSFLRLRLCWAVSTAGCSFIPVPPRVYQPHRDGQSRSTEGVGLTSQETVLVLSASSLPTTDWNPPD